MLLGYSQPKWRDRKLRGGGVLTAVKDCYNAVAIEQPDSDAEIVWVQVSLRNEHKLYLGSYYRTPSGRQLIYWKVSTDLSNTYSL